MKSARTLHLRPAESDDAPVAIALSPGAGGELQEIGLNDRTFAVRVRSLAAPALAPGVEGARLALTIDGQTRLAHVVRQGARIWVHVEGAVWQMEAVTPAAAGRPPVARIGAGASSGRILAAMPGRVLDILCAPGDRVQSGQTLVLLEAMKMELRLAAAADGVVAAVCVAPGAIVERGALLVEVTLVA